MFFLIHICLRNVNLIGSSCVCINGLFILQGGLYVFLLFDHYACSGMTLLFFAILQSACVGWVYGEMS